LKNKNASIGINLYPILPKETSREAEEEEVPFKISHKREYRWPNLGREKITSLVLQPKKTQKDGSLGSLIQQKKSVYEVCFWVKH